MINAVAWTRDPIGKVDARIRAADCSLDLYRFNPHAENSRLRRMLGNYQQRPRAHRHLFEDFIDHGLIAEPFVCVDVSSLEWYESDTVTELKEAEQIFARGG